LGRGVEGSLPSALAGVSEAEAEREPAAEVLSGAPVFLGAESKDLILSRLVVEDRVAPAPSPVFSFRPAEPSPRYGSELALPRFVA
jgi:hypothetical protein